MVNVYSRKNFKNLCNLIVSNQLATEIKTIEHVYHRDDIIY